ncbi:hypothetical protein HN873_016883, partial [Arachis hypogaea]
MLTVQLHDLPQPTPPPWNIGTSSALVCPSPPATARRRHRASSPVSLFSAGNAST